MNIRDLLPKCENELDPQPPQFDDGEYILGPAVAVPLVPEEPYPFKESRPETIDNNPEVSEINRAIALYGFEALAFYAPAHYYKKFGVYYIKDRLYKFASKIHIQVYAQTNTNNFRKTYSHVFNFIQRHEEYHFITELYSSIVEKYTVRETLYKNYNLTTKNEKGYNPLEEALANAYATDMKMPTQIKNALLDNCDNSPYGYRNYKDYMQKDVRLFVERWLAGRIEELPELDALDLGVFCPSRRFLLPPDPNLINEVLPKYWIDNVEKQNGLHPFRPENGVKIVIGVKDHAPPHIHLYLPDDSPIMHRYLYPTLEPLWGAPYLSKTDQTRVIEYINKHKEKIEQKLAQQNYKNNPFGMGPS